MYVNFRKNASFSLEIETFQQFYNLHLSLRDQSSHCLNIETSARIGNLTEKDV